MIRRLSHAIVFLLLLQIGILPAFAQTKVKNLPAASSVGPSDLFYVVAGGTADKKATAATVAESLTGHKMIASYASLSAAVSSISTTQATIVIPATTTVSASLTVPSNITLLPSGPGMISVSSGQTLTIQSSTEGWPARQVFTGNGSVVLSGPGRGVLPQWFGAKGDAKIVDDASVSGTTLTSATAGFTSAINGTKFDVSGAGAAAELCAIITSFTDSTHVEVSIAASYTASSQTITLDNVTIATGSMTLGDHTLEAGSAFFTADDVGKLVRCTGVGAKNIVGTLTYVNSTTATMSVSASVAVSARRLIFGTDDQAAFQKAINSLPTGGSVTVPRTKYIIGSALTVVAPGLTFHGAGMNASELYAIGPKMLDSGSVYHLLNINTPASNIHFEGVGFSGTNWTAQTSLFGVDTADGVYVSHLGPISKISATNCRFDSFWGIGFHNPGSAGLTIAASDAVTDITIKQCRAAFNSYDGLNPNPIAGVIIEGCTLPYNGTAAIESSTSHGSISNNYCYYNFVGGISLGGYGDPQSSESTSVTGNTCNLNGEYGIALASNQATAIVLGNTCRLNGLFGIGALASGGTLATRNRISGNICDSNGVTGAGSSGIYVNMDNVEVEGNTCTDRAVAGYAQQFGVLSYGANVNILRNYSLGNVSQDYSFQAGSAVFDNIYPAAVVFNGGATLTYPTIKVTDAAYGAGWNGSLEVPTKNAVYDKIETLGGGGGTGDVVGPSSSVDSEIALFNSTTGKLIKRASVTGILKGTSGVLSAATAGTDYTSPTSTEAFQNKTFANSNNTLGSVTVDVTGTDATGDIWYRNASGVLTRLAIGSTGDVLTVASGLPSWGAPSGGGGGLTIGTTTITSGTNTKVLFNNSGVVGEYTITGTGNVVMSASPTFSGTITAAAATFLGDIKYQNPSDPGNDYVKISSTAPGGNGRIDVYNRIASTLTIFGDGIASNGTLQLGSNNDWRWQVNNSLLPWADNSYNIGSSSLRVHQFFLAEFWEGDEMSDPSAPASNKGRLYFRDNGSGKTQLVVRFPTGAIQVIATEP